MTPDHLNHGDDYETWPINPEWEKAEGRLLSSHPDAYKSLNTGPPPSPPVPRTSCGGLWHHRFGCEFWQRMRVYLTNLWNWRTAWACRYMRKQLQRHPDFWRTYHANIAMPIYDQLNSLTPGYPLLPEHYPLFSNQCADRLMAHLFDAPPTPERSNP